MVVQNHCALKPLQVSTGGFCENLQIARKGEETRCFLESRVPRVCGHEPYMWFESGTFTVQWYQLLPIGRLIRAEIMSERLFLQALTAKGEITSQPWQKSLNTKGVDQHNKCQ